MKISSHEAMYRFVNSEENPDRIPRSHFSTNHRPHYADVQLFCIDSSSEQFFKSEGEQPKLKWLVQLRKEDRNRRIWHRHHLLQQPKFKELVLSRQPTFDRRSSIRSRTDFSYPTSPPRKTFTTKCSQLLDEKLGVIESSLQTSFVVEKEWLLAQYAVHNKASTPITLLYGLKNSELERAALDRNSNLKATLIKSSMFRTHHTKMMILSYTDNSIRVIVTTGNLIEKDWKNTTQGIWISPRLPCIESGPTGADVGDSETHFKKDLLDYLEAYKLPTVEPWIQKVKNADCREVKVFFIASVYGTHQLNAPIKWGLVRMAQLLSEHAIVPDEEVQIWPLYYQCSSFGSLGASPPAWLLGEFTETMRSSTNPSVITPEVKVIYPCIEDVTSSYDGLEAGKCLPYTRKGHEKQPWLNNYLCKWRSDKRHRTKAMPHIKNYCRLSPCGEYLSWFLLTSANVSKAAWGERNKAGTSSRILNYEAGVLFVPQILIAKSRLPLTNQSPSENGPQFSLPYDIPLVNYSTEDKPWLIDLVPNLDFSTTW